MTPPDPPWLPDEQGRPRPRGVRAELERLLENWLERAEEASRVDDPTPLEIAAIWGLLRRTEPSLVDSAEWRALRAAIEERASRLLDRGLLLRERLVEARARAQDELTGYLDAARLDGERRLDDLSERDRQMAALRVAERIDSLLLAAALAYSRSETMDAGDDDAARAVTSLGSLASLHGERFLPIAGWFAAMERSIDSAYLPDRLYWRGHGMRTDDAVLLASGAWIQTTHARIRAYRGEVMDEKANERSRRSRERQERVLDKLAHGGETAQGQWRLVGSELAGSVREIRMQLVRALAEGAAPRLAAAKAPMSAGGGVALEWVDPEGVRIARCSFNPGAGATSFQIEFFTDAGDLDRSLDGRLASWLGTTTGISGGRANFSADAMRSSASPLDAMRRCTALFVDGTPWSANFDGDDEALDDADEASTG